MVRWKIDRRVSREGVLLQKSGTEPLEGEKSRDHPPAGGSQIRASLTAQWRGLLGFCECWQSRPPPTLMAGAQWVTGALRRA